MKSKPLSRVKTILCAFVAALPIVAASAHDTKADDVAYVDCAWSPYKEAWGCGLPSTFQEGRFNAPPIYRQDDASEQARLRAFTQAKSEPGARAQGRLGVFIPLTDGGWNFVPGHSWSPGDPVFLPRPKTAKR